jgi:secreted trypsin-like serine protease
MTRRFIPALAAFLAIGACSDAPTNSSDAGNDPSFITYGELDGNAHPAVVLAIFDVGGRPAWRCSATLIAPKVVLTAGHCTGEVGEISGARIFTESDVQNGNNNYPLAGRNSVEAVSWASHPKFTNSAFFLHDVGILHLKKAVKLPANQYGKLPGLNQLDALRPSNSTRFTAVGYGLQRINPVFVEAERVRMYAEPHLIQINTPGFTGDFSLLLSNNASTGGTCFGDSGGPNYLGSSNVIAGVTSFGLNGNCAGTGGVFRLDRKDVLAFVNAHLN